MVAVVKFEEVQLLIQNLLQHGCDFSVRVVAKDRYELIVPKRAEAQLQWALQELLQAEAGCGNCHWVGKNYIPLSQITNLHQRLEPDGIVPAGDCPECGAFCYLTIQEETEE